jgi:hypothetical protein
MAQTFFPITPTDCTPGTGAWTDVDLDTYVASLGADVTGVLLRFHFTNYRSYATNWGARKNGSTDDVRPSYNAYDTTICGAFVGVDANHVFEVYVSDIYIKCYIIGYTKTGVTFFDNATVKSFATAGSWDDIDCSAQVPAGAKALIFECPTAHTSYTLGIRPNGSA